MWKYKGKNFDTPGDYYGFVYKITDNTGKIYLGKKAFSHRKKTKLSKKAKVGTRKIYNIQQIDSKWKDYYGSCKPLLEYIKERGTRGFKREIIKLCKDKASLSYHEIEYMFREKVLFREDCWNSNIAGKFFKGKIHE